jgi:hypothetical protein
VPLGIVHNDDRRGELMPLIQMELDAGRLASWAHKSGSKSNKKKRLPTNIAIDLDWFGGEGRELNSNPDYPDLQYYCDVTASPRPRLHSSEKIVIIEEPYTGNLRKIPLENRGVWTPVYDSIKGRDQRWIELEIREVDLCALRDRLDKASDDNATLVEAPKVEEAPLLTPQPTCEKPKTIKFVMPQLKSTMRQRPRKHRILSRRPPLSERFWPKRGFRLLGRKLKRSLESPSSQTSVGPRVRPGEASAD